MKIQFAVHISCATVREEIGDMNTIFEKCQSGGITLIQYTVLILAGWLGRFLLFQYSSLLTCTQRHYRPDQNAVLHTSVPL